MASFNRVILMGNLTRDPEIRLAGTTGHKVATMGLAMNEQRKDASGQVKEYPCFVDIEVWDRAAELCGQYLKKGSPVMVEGKLAMDTWEKDGQKRSKLKVRASTIKFLSSGNGQQRQDTAPAAAPAPAAPTPATNDLESDPDDVPF